MQHLDVQRFRPPVAVGVSALAARERALLISLCVHVPSPIWRVFPFRISRIANSWKAIQICREGEPADHPVRGKTVDSGQSRRVPVLGAYRDAARDVARLDQISAISRTGAPVAPFTFGRPTTRMASDGDSFSRLATFSRPQRPAGSQMWWVLKSFDAPLSS